MDEFVDHRPHPLLRGLVVAAHGYRIVGAAPGVHLGMPSSTLTVVIPLDEPLIMRQHGPTPRPFDTVLAGLHIGAAHIHHEGRQFGIQLQLAPLAARLLLGLPARELADVSVPIAEVLPDADRTVDRMRCAATWPQRFALLETALLDRAASAPGAVDRDLRHAWDLCHTAASIGAVAAEVGWSTRTLQKRFRAEFGISPAEPARLDRFHRSVHLASDPSRSLAEVAVLAGYSDQPHMTRSWSRFADITPARWRAVETLTTRDRVAVE
ncbi:helix-turn-helix domain-containing protein [Millisia brevis]|uniref:helix-turn-helix domain-containing protein n=1 Tax=Millisia brevis TaxID=264148 RepID=UPI0012ED744A|nr:helix-turn-helix domain-containing protein [Millisia brevis]